MRWLRYMRTNNFKPITAAALFLCGSGASCTVKCNSHRKQHAKQ